MTVASLDPHRRPLDEIREALGRSAGTDTRILVVVGRRRECELEDLQRRVREQFDATSGSEGGVLVIRRQKSGSARVRFTTWPDLPLDPSWGPDVVVMDQELPVVVFTTALRAAISGRVVLW